MPATWGVVAALLDEESAKFRPGSEACWYAPDIIDRLVRAKVAHEIGSHGGKHVQFGDIDASEAQEDLDFAREVHRANALPFKSFIFPREAAEHLDAPVHAGLRAFRGPDVGWFRTARRVGHIVGRGANFADKCLPIPPSPVAALKYGALINILGSMLLLGRNGPRRFILPTVSRAKLRMGLAGAQRTGGIFHLWFHPSNFYYPRDEQFATLAWFLE